MVIVGYPYPETHDDDRAPPREMVAISRAANKWLSAFAGDQRSASRHADSRAVRPRCLAEQPNERRPDLDRFNIENGSDAQRLTRRQADQQFPALCGNRAMTSAAFVVWAASDRTIAPAISSCPSPRKRVIAMPRAEQLRLAAPWSGCGSAGSGSRSWRSFSIGIAGSTDGLAGGRAGWSTSSSPREGAMSSAVQLLDAAGRRPSPATMPDFHAGRRPGTRVSATRLTRRRWMRSSRSCATPVTPGPAIASTG